MQRIGTEALIWAQVKPRTDLASRTPTLATWKILPRMARLWIVGGFEDVNRNARWSAPEGRTEFLSRRAVRGVVTSHGFWDCPNYPVTDLGLYPDLSAKTALTANTFTRSVGVTSIRTQNSFLRIEGFRVDWKAGSHPDPWMKWPVTGHFVPVFRTKVTTSQQHFCGG